MSDFIHVTHEEVFPLYREICKQVDFDSMSHEQMMDFIVDSPIYFELTHRDGTDPRFYKNAYFHDITYALHEVYLMLNGKPSDLSTPVYLSFIILKKRITTQPDRTIETYSIDTLDNLMARGHECSNFRDILTLRELLMSHRETLTKGGL